MDRRAGLAVVVLFLAVTGVLAQEPSAPAPGDAVIQELERMGRGKGAFALRVTFEVYPGKLDGFLAEAQRVATFTNGKDGARFYRFFQQIDRPTRVVLLEEWPDLPSLRAHLDAAHTRQFLAAVVPMGAEPIRIRYYAPASEGVDPATADPTADGPPPAQPTAEQTRQRLAEHGLATAPFVLLVDLPLNAGAGARMKRTATRVQSATVREPGAVRYAYYQDLTQTDDFLLFEWWDQFKSMEAHLGLPHFKELMRAFAAYGAQRRSVSIFRPLPF